jgi:hypothetical protein
MDSRQFRAWIILTDVFSNVISRQELARHFRVVVSKSGFAASGRSSEQVARQIEGRLWVKLRRIGTATALPVNLQQRKW